MNLLNELSLFLGTSWASGINLYLTVALLGIMDRSGAIALPQSLDVLSNPLVIGVAILVYAIEFVADKVPYVDTAWDSVHTFIRPAGGTILAYMTFSQSPEAVRFSMALLGGTIALDSHMTKASARVAINTSPEPVTNSVASVTEDGLVAVGLWLVFTHPVIASILILSFIVFSVWFLKVMFRFVKKVFRFLSTERPVAQRPEASGGEIGDKGRDDK
jgi:hypothetical protein